MYIVNVSDQALQPDQKKKPTENLHMSSESSIVVFFLLDAFFFFSYAKWYLVMAKHYIVLS